MKTESVILQPPSKLRKRSCEFRNCQTSPNFRRLPGSAASHRLLPLVFLVLCMAALASAQNTNSGDFRGTVTDASGAFTPKAVTILDLPIGNAKGMPVGCDHRKLVAARLLRVHENAAIMGTDVRLKKSS